MITGTTQADTCIDQQLSLGLELGTRELFDLGLPTPDTAGLLVTYPCSERRRKLLNVDGFKAGSLHRTSCASNWTALQSVPTGPQGQQHGSTPGAALATMNKSRAGHFVMLQQHVCAERQ